MLTRRANQRVTTPKNVVKYTTPTTQTRQANMANTLDWLTMRTEQPIEWFSGLDERLKLNVNYLIRSKINQVKRSNVNYTKSTSNTVIKSTTPSQPQIWLSNQPHQVNHKYR